MTRSTLVSALFLAVVTGCSAAPSHEDQGTADSAIIHGTASTTAQDAVVMIMHIDRTSNEMFTCTGTLVMPNLVLTARHCVSDTDESSQCTPAGVALHGGRILGDLDPASLYVFTGTRAPDPSDPSTGPVAKGKQTVATSATTLCNNDIAFLVLDRDVAAPTAPIRTGTPSVGETITAVGWGVTDRGPDPSVRQQRTGVPIVDVGPSVNEPAGEFIVGESICSGDSGGPAFDARGAIVGVVSRGGNGRGSATNPAQGCTGVGTYNTYTRVAAFPTLIAAAESAANDAR